MKDSDSIEAWRNRKIAQINATLANRNSAEISNILHEYHFGVDYKNGHLITMNVKTIDGTDGAGLNGCNIGYLDVTLLLNWSSLIRSDGFTEVSLVQYPATDTPPRLALNATNAVFTKKDFVEFGLKLFVHLLR
jgi:hypothetical protein